VQRKPGSNPVISTHERLLQNSWGLMALPAAVDDGRPIKEKLSVVERLTA
jgi:hypothetical protein